MKLDYQYHKSVLLEPAIEGLNIKTDGKYLDATLGGGGHSREILNQGGQVLALDLDPDAIDHVKQTLVSPHLNIVQANYRDFDQICTANNFLPLDGIIFDLGISSHQVDEPSRGFSFNTDYPLDMRFDRTTGISAAQFLEAKNEAELEHIFRTYGGETYSRKIAAAIVNARNQQPITGTGQLADLITRIYPLKRGKIHPATKVFQALRIAVNDELNNLKIALPKAVRSLKPGGRVVIISFHEGEDRIVKQFIKQQQFINQIKSITKKPITPSADEIEQNPRSRSAKLRIAEKL
jgi:16S rRNA (cytosine1402-N4)-methyltransferase